MLTSQSSLCLSNKTCCYSCQTEDSLQRVTNNKRQNIKVELIPYFLYFQALNPIQNDTKEVKTSSLENAKPQDDDEEINKQTAADMQTFKEVNPLNDFFFPSGRFLVTSQQTQMTR